jgi:hypothetical protein
MSEQTAPAAKPQVNAEDLMEGARNLVRYSGLQPGNTVLLLVGDTADDPQVVDAVSRAVEEAGGILSTLKVKAWSRALGRPPQLVVDALPTVDVVIQQGASLNGMATYVQRAMYEHGTNIAVNMARSAAALSSDLGRYPVELLYAIGERMLAKVQAGRTLRITTPAGTDLTAEVHPRHIGGYFYPARRGWPGQSKAFPGGEFGVHPEDPCNGVIVVEALQPDLSPPESILSEPLVLTVRDHWVADFQGPLAGWIQDLLRQRGDDRGTYFAEIMWGIHPRSGFPGCRAASNPHLLHVSLGNGMPYGGRYHSAFQLPLYMFEPTVTLDGEPLLQDGRLLLLEERGLRDVAARYGDPDELLAIRPIAKEVSVFGRR